MYTNDKFNKYFDVGVLSQYDNDESACSSEEKSD